MVSDDRASVDSRPLPCFVLFVSLDERTFDDDGAYGGCIVSWWNRIIIIVC